MHPSLHSGLKLNSLDFCDVNTKSEIVHSHSSEDFSLLGADNMEFGRQA
jgi:hypothetical protein